FHLPLRRQIEVANLPRLLSGLLGLGRSQLEELAAQALGAVESVKDRLDRLRVIGLDDVDHLHVLRVAGPELTATRLNVACPADLDDVVVAVSHEIEPVHPCLPFVTCEKWKAGPGDTLWVRGFW